MNIFSEGWYLIYTKPKHEKKVVEQLAKFEIENFLPTTKSVRKWCDRKKVITAPLFPSYVFVKLNNLKNYFTSLEVEGVLYFVRSGKEIAKVYDDIVYRLKLLVHHCKEIEVSSERILPGKKMVITEGPFTGFHCEVVEHMGNKKMLVRVDLLHRNILLKLPYDNLIYDENYALQAIQV